MLSFAVGTPDGPRSQVWTVWAQAGSSDVYLRAIRGQDFKVSLHDPAKSKAGLPWVFAATDEYMRKYNDPARTPDKVIARWGPFGGYPPGTVEAVRVLFPAGELRAADPALTPPPHTRWSDDAGKGYARAFTITFEPGPIDESSSPYLWRHELSNGRVAVLREGTTGMTAPLSTTLELKRAHLSEAWLKDIADGRVDPGAPGRHAAAGLHALPPEGHLLTILEWTAAAYWLAGSSAPGSALRADPARVRASGGPSADGREEPREPVDEAGHRLRREIVEVPVPGRRHRRSMG